jgi:hypothetical protein
VRLCSPHRSSWTSSFLRRQVSDLNGNDLVARAVCATAAVCAAATGVSGHVLLLTVHDLPPRYLVYQYSYSLRSDRAHRCLSPAPERPFVLVSTHAVADSWPYISHLHGYPSMNHARLRMPRPTRHHVRGTAAIVARRPNPHTSRLGGAGAAWASETQDHWCPWPHSILLASSPLAL